MKSNALLNVPVKGLTVILLFALLIVSCQKDENLTTSETDTLELISDQEASIDVDMEVTDRSRGETGATVRVVTAVTLDASMTDDLDLPMDQPYADAPDETTTIPHFDTFVDWVLLELKRPTDFEVVGSRAALLATNGFIYQASGPGAGFAPMVEIEVDEVYESYYLAIKHRNHLGCMSENPLTMTWWPGGSVGTIQSTDFRSASEPTFGTHARKISDTGGATLWLGDANDDGQVVMQGPGNDPGAILFAVLSHPLNGPPPLANYIVQDVYDNADVEMDRDIIYQGPGNEVSYIMFETILVHPGNPGNLANYIVSEQIP